MMMLHDSEITVQHQPMDQVRQLAHATSDALRGLSLGDGQSLLIALPLSGSTYEFPDGEGLARMNDQSVDMPHRQGQIGGLVLLELHVHITQTATDEGVVAIDDNGQGILRPLPGKMGLMQPVLKMTLQDLLLHRQAIGERRYLAKQSPFHVQCPYDVQK